MDSVLPQYIASLNGLSLFLLIVGFVCVRKKRITLHRIVMGLATFSSTLFLIIYLIHHYNVGSVPYPRHDWTRIVYFIILIPHVLLAAGMVPFIIMAIRYGVQNKLEAHKKITRYLFPVWVYVSVTGLLVYFMLY